MDQAQPIPLICPDCTFQMPETAVFCPGCGRSMQRPAEARPISESDQSGDSPSHDSQNDDSQNHDSQNHDSSSEQLLKTELPAAELPRNGKVGALPENIGGALVYFTFIPAILLLVVEPYKKNRFVRFHAAQCLLLWVVGVSVFAALKLSGLILFHVPLVGPLLIVLLWGMVVLALVLIWAVLVVKALQGEMFELPLLGNLAALYADFS